MDFNNGVKNIQAVGNNGTQQLVINVFYIILGMTKFLTNHLLCGTNG